MIPINVRLYRLNILYLIKLDDISCNAKLANCFSDMLFRASRIKIIVGPLQFLADHGNLPTLKVLKDFPKCWRESKVKWVCVWTEFLWVAALSIINTKLYSINVREYKRKRTTILYLFSFRINNSNTFCAKYLHSTWPSNASSRSRISPAWILCSDDC